MPTRGNLPVSAIQNPLNLLRHFSVILFVLSCSASIAQPSLRQLADIPLPGNATRFDYQSIDPEAGTLYLNHMNDGEVIVFDLAKGKIKERLKGFPTCTGILVVPSLHKLFVSAAGNHEVAIVDTRTLQVLARVPAGTFPDGLAYSPDSNRVYVSDEHGKREIMIDAAENKAVGDIEMGGEVGNTQYDSGSHMILANVQTSNELVVIDPKTDQIVGRHKLNGGVAPHGLLIHPDQRLAFAACEGDSKLLVIDLNDYSVKQVLSTGPDPDVLAFDFALNRLYVGTESETVSVFQLQGRKLQKIEDLKVGSHAHSVSVHQETHKVYVPLQNVNGSPVLRIMTPIISGDSSVPSW